MIDFLLFLAMLACGGVLIAMAMLARVWWLVHTGRYRLPEPREGIAVNLRTNEWVITNERRN